MLLAHGQAGRSGGQEEGRAAQAAVGQELGPQSVEDVGDEEAPPDIFRGLVGEGRTVVQRGAQVGELSLGTQSRRWHGVGGSAAMGWPGVAHPAPKGVLQERAYSAHPIYRPSGSLQPISVKLIPGSIKIHRGQSNYRAAAVGTAPHAAVGADLSPQAQPWTPACFLLAGTKTQPGGPAVFPPPPPPLEPGEGGRGSPHLRDGTGKHQAPVGQPGAAGQHQPVDAEAEEGEDVEHVDQHLEGRTRRGSPCPRWHGEGGCPALPPPH